MIAPTTYKKRVMSSGAKAENPLGAKGQTLHDKLSTVNWLNISSINIMLVWLVVVWIVTRTGDTITVLTL